MTLVMAMVSAPLSLAALVMLTMSGLLPDCEIDKVAALPSLSVMP